MRKKDTLYKVNKWNRPAFMPQENLFAGIQLGSNQMYNSNSTSSPMSWLNTVNIGRFGTNGSITGSTRAGSGVFVTGKDSSGDSGTNGDSGANFGQVAMTAASAFPDSPMTVNGHTYKRGAFDAADPLYHLAGNNKTGIGEAANDAGVGIFKQGAQQGNGPMMLAGAIVKSGGDVINWLLGEEVDEEKDAANKEATGYYGNFRSDAKSTDAVQGLAAMHSYQNAHTGGVFKKGAAAAKNASDRRQYENAFDFAQNSITNNIDNILEDNINNQLANYSAYGGPLESDMGAIDYGFMSDYLTMKKKQAQDKNKVGNMFAGLPSGMFAFGGDMQTNGADYPSGLMHISAGGSHESNPYDGVQLGTDSEGTPNLVEENETVYNDYVYSNRITLDQTAKEKFHFPKKKDITYAEATKKLEKEIAERPNDPVSKAGFKSQMETLAEHQERQKQEMEAERAKAAFEALSPEEQVAVMNQAAQEEQAAQQQEALAVQQEALNQQPPSPEEVAMMQQQKDANQQEAVAANGGLLVKASEVENNPNVFAAGGHKGTRKARRITKNYDKDWFLNQAKSLGISEEEMKNFVFDANDPEANIANFNNIYLKNQKDKALETYTKGQRKSKENELFDPKTGLYRMSDDGKKVYQAVTRSEGQDYVDADGNFISQDKYKELDDKAKESYKKVTTRLGDKLYDYNGKLVETEYNGDKDDLLGTFAYDEGFKWDDKDAQTLQYPVSMEHSPLSYARYAPALGGLFGLAYDTFNPADYSRAQSVINASSGFMNPMMVHQNYNPTYVKPHVFDIWQQRNKNAANLNSAIRTFENTVNPNKSANVQLALYNALNADGQLGIDADKYNREDEFRVAGHNSGENKTFAQMDLQAQMANQNALLHSGRYGLQGLMAGYQMMDDIDARRAASRSANLTNVLQSIGNIGEEAYDEDRLKWLERNGVLRSNYYGQKQAACGGKLKKGKRRGLTF